MKNFYFILEVSPDATGDKIKSQYRKLVRECHPDQFLEPHVKLHYEEKLKEINRAYAHVLESHLASNVQINAEAVPNKAPLSNISVLMGIVSLFILLLLTVVLLVPKIGLSKVAEIENQPQMTETVSENLEQSLLLKDNSSQNEISSQTPKAIVRTPKLGSTVHSIDPLRIRAMARDEKCPFGPANTTNYAPISATHPCQFRRVAIIQPHLLHHPVNATVH